jgi:hypothetical protein
VSSASLRPGPSAAAERDSVAAEQAEQTQVYTLDAAQPPASLPPVDLAEAFAAQEFPSEVGDLDVLQSAPRAEFEQPAMSLEPAQTAEILQPAAASEKPKLSEPPAAPQPPKFLPPFSEPQPAASVATPSSGAEDPRVDLRVLRQRVAQLEQQLTQQALTFNEKLLAQSSHLNEAVTLKQQVAELTREHARVQQTARAEVQDAVRAAQAQALAWQNTCAEQRVARQASEQAAQAALQQQQALQQQAARDAQKIAQLDAQGRELQAQLAAHAQQKVQVRQALDGVAEQLQVLLPASHS